MIPVYTLVWESCEVASVTRQGTALWIRLSAAAVVAKDATSACSTTKNALPTGYLRPLLLCMEGVQDLPDDLYRGAWVGGLSEGLLDVNGTQWRTLLLPCHMQGALCLSLRFRAHAELTLKGTALRATVDPAAVYTESYAC